MEIHSHAGLTIPFHLQTLFSWIVRKNMHHANVLLEGSTEPCRWPGFQRYLGGDVDWQLFCPIKWYGSGKAVVEGFVQRKNVLANVVGNWACKDEERETFLICLSVAMRSGFEFSWTAGEGFASLTCTKLRSFSSLLPFIYMLFCLTNLVKSWFLKNFLAIWMRWQKVGMIAMCMKVQEPTSCAMAVVKAPKFSTLYSITNVLEWFRTDALGQW